MAHDATRTRPLAGVIASGALAGIVGAMLMAAFAMIAAATYQGTGFFTPLYHIGSSVGSPDAMMRSMESAARGDPFTFIPGDALLGGVIHLAWGAFWGAGFFVLARVAGLHAWTAAVAGVVYGLVVMAFMSFVTLPITASLFGGGVAIRDMPEMVGWGTFALEHAIFGLSVGLGVALGSRGRAAVPRRVRTGEAATA